MDVCRVVQHCRKGLQGVGHPISCLGVCYVNDPPKGGYTTHAPVLDLTTSLRGDLVRMLVHRLRLVLWIRLQHAFICA